MGYITQGVLKYLVALEDRCPACFWWHIKHYIKRESMMSQLPNAVESNILNNIFLKHRREGTLPLELNIPELKGFKLIDEETHKKWKDPKIGIVFKDLKAVPDDVLTNGKKLILIDIKTTGKNTENCTRKSMEEDIEKYSYTLQLAFYAYVMRKAGYDTEDFGYILFYYFDHINKNRDAKIKYEIFKINFDLKDVERLLQEARRLLELDEAPKCRCKFCSSHQEKYDDHEKKQKENEENVNEILGM